MNDTKSSMMTFKQLIEIVAEADDFCPIYTMNNLTVDECFPEVEGDGYTWSDEIPEDILTEILDNEVTRHES